MDEHCIGLKPILRRVWARRGQRPAVVVHPRYQWSYVYGLVHPRTGRTFFLILPTVSLAAFEVALREFARFIGAGPNKHVFLVLDRAGWLTSGQLLLPPGLYLCFLPPYSPELQPAEHLWPLTKRPLVNRRFDSLEVRANTVASQAESGNIKLLKGPWNKEFLTEVALFPYGAHDDQVDAMTGAYQCLLELMRSGVTMRQGYVAGRFNSKKRPAFEFQEGW